MCEAVRELHECFNPPLIHRDLKPANIVLSNGRVFLIDFGIARVYRSGSVSDTSHLGTRAYAPPEQYGFGQTDTRSDVYDVPLKWLIGSLLLLTVGARGVSFDY